ncbi:MAG TPA: sigma-54 dependent transcriptional regulator [Polyangiaceae bacterium]|jgi:two-component system response regulator PilR (NtrC family)|nr:sigma-54 dependent transcriptional regulator [Polyangiaceae bacterium]HNZ23494.1 sigma-54 dependent transcriptional regulator [Polyangiaceae bacterium]HOD23027.1 sigma-54 dependent transcriptional regulator [Polyangiaceae bacterium]HOE49586.1 sigma-54 dependent transcriptional regulator [Polyangiaceae bacterium]HOH01265.1 sigma-54 dependent transcriptional regulator [Polyangiaceae bacterium]
MSVFPANIHRRILVVDDEPALRDTLSILFRRESYDVVTAPGCRSAIEAIQQADPPFPVVLTDLRMPDGDGFEVLEAAKARSEATEIIVMTAFHEHAFDAMRRGAYDFVSKPFPSLREVLERVGKAAEKAGIVAENVALRAQVEAAGDKSWVARSPGMLRVMEIIEKVADTKTTVLITGESGTGKERVARLIHEKGGRAHKPFLVVNCGALPESLMESELFGHERGAFTGASSKHLGMLRAADGGTLLLDEVGELPTSLQVKLLRVLQEKKVRPVGGTTESEVDVRILAATNADIETAVSEGRFRKDLYYRLNVIRLVLPPLRERPEDLERLVDSFLRRFSAEMGKGVTHIGKSAFRALKSYEFPGNVRELENIMERAVALSDGVSLELSDLPQEVIGGGGRSLTAIELPEQGCKLDDVLANVERSLILQALARTGEVKSAAAELLGISFRSIRYRMNKLAIEEDEEELPSSRGGQGSSPRSV